MAKRKRDSHGDVRTEETGRSSRTGRQNGTSIAKDAASSAASTKAHEAQIAANGQAATSNMHTSASSTSPSSSPGGTAFQIVTGSYERVLHGFIASFPADTIANGTPASQDASPRVDFSDSFLFNAHASSIRCLALSPPSDESPKITLATGSTDERINLYSLSTIVPKPSKSKPKLPSLHGTSISENSRNKELGSLLHHSSSVTALYFPTRSKMLSSAEDSTIAITRTRDWQPLSTIKAPIPKPQGRPSGDTAAPGEVPAGVNDFAVHPSMKLMVSVGKGERCMRLWNLVTGKKAGVLNFGKDILASAGEGRFGTGEGRGVVWDAGGEEFAVSFERGIVLFGIDCKPRAKILPVPRTKVHRVSYLLGGALPNILLVSTEDGRILIYDTASTDSASPPDPPAEHTPDTKAESIPPCKLIAQIGGPASGISGRIKDFAILPFSPATSSSSSSTDTLLDSSTPPSSFLIIAGSSDGTVRLWKLDSQDLALKWEASDSDVEGGKGFTARQAGTLMGTYSTGTRITCLTAFAMTGSLEEARREESEEAQENGNGGEVDSSSSSEENE